MTARDPTASGADSPLALLEMINSGWMAQAIHVAARLGIADRLAEGPRSCDELAASVGAHPGALRRLLRGLASLGLCREAADGAFALTPLGEHLRADAPGSLRSLALFFGGSLWPAWGALVHCVKTGKRARSLGSREGAFEHLAQRPEAARVFDAAMVEVARLIADSLVRGYDFSGIGRIVELGGGHGALLVAILRAHPAMRGVLFDLPHVVDGARAHLEAAGVADRCEVVPGSFFESVPSGADAYLLKSVIHDWDDERSLAILENCRRAMPEKGGRLLLVERIVPERMEACAEHRVVAASDLNMLVATEGRERTEAEYRALLGSAGLELTRSVPIGAGYSVIEAAR
jgi:hypothetical protein